MPTVKAAKRPTTRSGDEYATPPEFVAALEQEFGAFDLDPAATAQNAKAPRFFTIADDGLQQPWVGRVFCNPPYGNHGLARWCAKALQASIDGAFVVMLLPAWTDSDWWHDIVWPHAELRFQRRRIRFLSPDGRADSRPVRSSVVAIFRPTPSKAD